MLELVRMKQLKWAGRQMASLEIELLYVCVSQIALIWSSGQFFSFSEPLYSLPLPFILLSSFSSSPLPCLPQSLTPPPSLHPPSISFLPPFSKREIGISTFELHEAHCQRHIRLCEVCQDPVPIQNMEEHFAENHAPTSCDLCGASMPKDKLEEHMVTVACSSVAVLKGSEPLIQVHCSCCFFEIWLLANTTCDLLGDWVQL